jgi:hypothetical protein
MMSQRPTPKVSAVRTVLVALVGAALLPTVAPALPRYGPFEVSGNVSSQQLIRMSDWDRYALVQQRNTLKLRLDYQMIQNGKLIDRFEMPFVEQSNLFVLYRGVYDSVYDTTPGFSQNDIYGNPIGLHLDELSGREALRFENSLREAYTDVKFKTIPLTLRLGRQQIVWGETDSFRLLDRVNPLDLTWHLQQESWDELRRPYWMIKGLYDLDRIGPLSNPFVEFYWNPGDWHPAKRDFLQRPWSAPVVNPLTDPRHPPPEGRGLFNLINKYSPYPDVTRLYKDTTLFNQGDYTRDPLDNSQVGVRFSAVTPQGMQFTLNYFYQRWAGDDGTNAAAYTGVLDAQDAKAALKRGEAPIEAIAPYVHTIGGSANYADEDFTQTVYRFETVYDMGVPFTDASKQFSSSSLGLLATFIKSDVFGISKRDMWKGMVGFDRPTWIRPVNRTGTVLISGQFFWHYLIDNPDIACNDPKEAPPCSRSGQGRGFRGQFSTSGLASTGQIGKGAVIDKVRDWETLVTLGATTFYRGGKVVPLLVYVLDPVNKYNMEVIGSLDYFLTNNLFLNLSQRYFINTTSQPVYEGWGVAGMNRGRSETGIRLTYQF